MTRDGVAVVDQVPPPVVLSCGSHIPPSGLSPYNPHPVFERKPSAALGFNKPVENPTALLPSWVMLEKGT